MSILPIKLKAIITIEIDATDIEGVERHRSRLDGLVAELTAAHGAAQLEIKPRRTRHRPRATPPPKLNGEYEIVRARYVG